MGIVANMWQEYSTQVVEREGQGALETTVESICHGLPAEDAKELRRAFYAGVISAITQVRMNIFAASLKKDPEVIIDGLEAMQSEIKQFVIDEQKHGDNNSE
jgi:hypothetical protein